MTQKPETKEPTKDQLFRAIERAEKASVKLHVANRALISLVSEPLFREHLAVGTRDELDAILKIMMKQLEELNSSLSQADKYFHLVHPSVLKLNPLWN